MKNRVGVDSSEICPQKRWRCSEVWDKAIQTWNRCQIGHRSQYSVERALALQDYLERTSFLGAFTVCFLTPIPAMAVALAIDCIPLKKPSDGWQANYTLWIRLFIAMFVVSMGLILQINGVVEKQAISNGVALRICLGSASTYVVISFTVSATLMFPIPFGYVLMVGPPLMTFSIIAAFSIGLHVLATSPVIRNQLMVLVMIVFAQGTVGVAYPIFNAIFIRLSGTHQTIFVIVMPIIKFTTKQIIAYAAKSLHEYVGPIIVFSVDVFNVFYVLICMQTATPTSSTLIFVATDSFHVILAVHDILQQQALRAGEIEILGRSSSQYLRDLQEPIMTIIQAPKSSQVNTRRVRVLAPFTLPLSIDNRAFLDELSKTQPSPHNYPTVIKLASNPTVQHIADCEKQSARSQAEAITKLKHQAVNIPMYLLLGE